jgi:hypothetical protein
VEKNYTSKIDYFSDHNNNPGRNPVIRAYIEIKAIGKMDKSSHQFLLNLTKR